MKIGVVIQGPVGNFYTLNKNVEILRQTFRDEDILISTWEETGKQKREQATISDYNGNLFGINTVRSSLDIFKKFGNSFNAVNVDNIVYQCYNTSKGVQEFGSRGYDFVIKVRTDEYYKGLEEVTKELSKHPEKIHSGSLFYRGDYPFHFGDHLVAGSCENMSDMYVGLLQYAYDLLNDAGGKKFYNEWKQNRWNNIIFKNVDGDIPRMVQFTYADIPPETKIAVNYLISKLGRDPKASEHKELMQKYFNAIDIRKFSEFLFCANGVAYGTVLTEKNIDENKNFVFEYTKCKDSHEDWLLCEVDENNALLKKLFESEIRSNDDITDLKSDYETYASVYRPVKVLEEYKNQTRLQNFKF